MFDKLLPQRIDNTYRGYRVALWLFGLVVGMMTAQSVLVIFNGYSTVMNADGIPLDTYPPAAAQTIVAVFALRSLLRLIIALLCVLVLVRYRSAIPFMFVILVLNFLLTQLILQIIPMVRTGTPPGTIVNRIMFALMIIGLALSLRTRSIHA